MSARDAAPWPVGADHADLAKALRVAHDRFVTTGLRPVGVRPLVADSWARSARSGVDPERSAPPVALDHRSFAAFRVAHPLAAAMPVIRRLLVDGAAREGLVIALTDDQGRLLWVEGDAGVRRAVERIGFVEGASWREEDAGTNAPGIALATRREVQLFAAEHFTLPVQAWSCTAVPVRDPRTGRILGVLDVTGGDVVASPLMLALVRATVLAVEHELGATGPGARVQLDVLGADGGRLRLGAGGEQVRLSQRHAELLVLLAVAPHGLTGEELGVLLHHGEISEVTVRAELSRLRRVVGGLLGESRPYRLAAPVDTDIDTVRAALVVGDLLAALQAYPGPVLPRSDAPGVERLRAELSAELRAAVLACQDGEVVDRWVACPEGADDWQAWGRLVELSAEGTPRRARARGRLDLLARELGAGPARQPWR